MKRKAAIIGDGAWGTALGLVLHENEYKVTIWGPFPEQSAAFQKKGENDRFLPGVPVPSDISWTSSREQAADGADIVVLAVPTKFYHDAVSSFRELIPPDALIVSVAKGLDAESHSFMSAVAEKLLNHTPVAALSGPSHAEEVARQIPTAVVVACSDPDVALRLQDAFSTPRFRVYTSDDVTGVQLGGALKNIIAIAVGMSDGLGFGDNTRAALITRGLAEITRLGSAVGAQRATFSGLSGMGDLIVTCASGLSRNRAVGERLGKGESIESILASMTQAAEGVWNCASARAMAHTLGVEVPITDEVYAILNEGKSPAEAVSDLLSRDVKPESESG